MSDDVAAPAVAESVPAPAPAPAAEPVVTTTNPINTEGEPAKVEAKAEPVKSEPNARAAIERAALKVEAADKADKAKEAAPADKTAPVKDAGPTRDETGKFTPKDGMPKPAMPADQPITKGQIDALAKPGVAASDAPARFSADAKAAWSTAPEPVKAEVSRAIKEMEAGIEKHRASAEAFEPVRKFHEMAIKGNTTLDKALTAYVGIEEAWRSNPANGFMAVCANMKVDPLQQAKAIYEALSNTPGLPKGDSHEVAELKRQLAEIRGEVGNITKSTKEREIHAQVAQWAADKPRFEELSDDIAKLLSTGYAKDLDEAYAYAERLKPGAAPAIPQPVPAKGLEPDLTAQTLKGSKSVAGAPNSGSNPAKRPPSPTSKAAVERAFARAS